MPLKGDQASPFFGLVQKGLADELPDKFYQITVIIRWCKASGNLLKSVGGFVSGRIKSIRSEFLNHDRMGVVALAARKRLNIKRFFCTSNVRDFVSSVFLE
ncbi:hypothetical protein A616_07945 [Brevibacillus brevis X23]|nr:hypothetical protein A616_07945 [Brevibacillus brevis X23]